MNKDLNNKIIYLFFVYSCLIIIINLYFYFQFEITKKTLAKGKGRGLGNGTSGVFNSYNRLNLEKL
jgi:hypothetical protein